MLALPRHRKLPILFVGIALLAVIGCCVYLPNLAAPVSPAVNTPAVSVSRPNQSIEAGLPVRLKIPSIGIDAPISAMEIDGNGDMEAPTGAKDTGWYKLGPRPGDIGSAVIAGHYGRWKNGDASVFDTLNTLKKGDHIYVQDDKGTMVTFIVRESRMLKRDDNSKSVFTSNDKKAHLNLITCQGTWSESEGTYSDRLIVFADMQ